MRFQIILPTSAICSVTVISKKAWLISITYRNPQHVVLLGQLDNDYYHLQCDIKSTRTSFILCIKRKRKWQNFQTQQKDKIGKMGERLKIGRLEKSDFTILFRLNQIKNKSHTHIQKSWKMTKKTENIKKLKMTKNWEIEENRTWISCLYILTWKHTQKNQPITFYYHNTQT